MKHIILSILCILAGYQLSAQNSINHILGNIEQNNTTLKALRESAEAQKLENRTGLQLSDPEVGFNYLWGSPSSIGNRYDISVSQSFDIATIAGMKGKVANQKNELVEWQYKADRMNILLEAKNYCLDLIYYNALSKEMQTRLIHAESIEKAIKQKLQSGEANMLEYNKAKLNLSTVKGEIVHIETERKAIVDHLTRLNGNNPVSLDDTDFQNITLPANFTSWFNSAAEKNPALAYAKKEVELSKKQLALNKTECLPSVAVGYMSENVTGESFQGISLGVSIPLWSNKNRIKQAKNAVRAAESRADDARTQLVSKLNILYNRVEGLQNTASTYKESLHNANNTELLKKALDAGEISMLDYLIEIGLFCLMEINYPIGRK